MKRNICSKIFLGKNSDPQIHPRRRQAFVTPVGPPLSLAGAPGAWQAVGAPVRLQARLPIAIYACQSQSTPARRNPRLPGVVLK